MVKINLNPLKIIKNEVERVYELSRQEGNFPDGASRSDKYIEYVVYQTGDLLRRTRGLISRLVQSISN